MKLSQMHSARSALKQVTEILTDLVVAVHSDVGPGAVPDIDGLELGLLEHHYFLGNALLVAGTIAIVAHLDVLAALVVGIPEITYAESSLEGRDQ